MGPKLEVCVEAIRREAVVWDQQAHIPRRVAEAADGLRLNVAEALLFVLVVNANNEVCDFVKARCVRADQNVMANISVALRRNADSYERLEHQLTEHVEKAY